MGEWSMALTWKKGDDTRLFSLYLHRHLSSTANSNPLRDNPCWLCLECPRAPPTWNWDEKRCEGGAETWAEGDKRGITLQATRRSRDSLRWEFGEKAQLESRHERGRGVRGAGAEMRIKADPREREWEREREGEDLVGQGIDLRGWGQTRGGTALMGATAELAYITFPCRSWGWAAFLKVFVLALKI